MSTVVDMDTLRINYLTQAQYDALISGGTVEEDEIYLTPSSGGEVSYDFTTSLTPTIDARGVSQYSYIITPANSSDLTVANALKIKGYLSSGNNSIYPLINVYSSVNSGTYCFTTFKSIYFNVQGTSSSTLSGTLHIVAPFEISTVAVGM